MSARIIAPDRDPLGVMLNDYHHGDTQTFLNVWSDTFEMSVMTGAHMFRQLDEMDDLEKMALAQCRGRVLDVGGGSGCHSLVLQGRGLEVDAIDISPGCVELMAARGVHAVRLCDLHDQSLAGYDTVLMLMNGTGVCGTLDGLNAFLQSLDRLLTSAGQLIIDSTDVSSIFAGSEDTVAEGESYCGETQLVMIYKGTRSDPFDWLYIDFPLLQTMAGFHGLHCERIFDAEDGRYLAKITL